MTISREWSEWGDWSSCSRPCGGGLRNRTRTCDECPGCNIQYTQCNNFQCTNVRKFTPWTPWSTVDEGNGEERRYRHICRASLSATSDIQIGKIRTETRRCNNYGYCNKTSKYKLTIRLCTHIFNKIQLSDKIKKQTTFISRF